MNSNNHPSGSTQATAEDRPRLRRSTRSTRHARPIDAPYWEAIGYDRPTAMDMANFTQFVIARTQNGHHAFTRPFSHRGIVPFHEQLLPHWRVFAKSLQANEDGGNAISMSSVHIPKVVFDIIGPAISNMSGLRRLDLDKVQLDEDGLLAVADILRHQPAMTFLALPRNEISCVESAGIFSEAVRDHPALEALSLHECALGKNEKVLEAILDGCTALTIVDLRNNGIDSKGVGAISSFVVGNNVTVKALDLEGNAFSDEDVPHLVTSLKRNSCLGYFDVSKNNLSIKGREEMVTAVFDTTSLTNLVASNHSCKLVVSSAGNEHELLQYHDGEVSVPFETEMQTLHDIAGHREAKIQFKVLRVLHYAIDREDEVSLQYLNDVPSIKCMPRVLALAQKHMGILGTDAETGDPGFFLTTSLATTSSRERKDLGRLFHIMKGWIMPTLCSYRCTEDETPPKEKPLPKYGLRKRKRRNA